MSKGDKIRQQVIEEIFSLLQETFNLIGVESITTLLEAYQREEIGYSEVLERIEDFNDQFDLSEFLKKRNQKVRNESIKLGKSYYSISGVISLGRNSCYDFEENQLKYQIILNPTTSEIIKLLYANVVIMEFLSEKERDEELNYLVDKLNLIGVRHINIR